MAPFTIVPATRYVGETLTRYVSIILQRCVTGNVDSALQLTWGKVGIGKDFRTRFEACFRFPLLLSYGATWRVSGQRVEWRYPVVHRVL